MNSGADEIKRRVSMEDVLEQYGFTQGRAGFMACPFHQGDRTPSLKVYRDGGGWHCFGCGRGGSVIDFVMELFEIDFRQAVVRLDNDFRLGLTAEKPDRRGLDNLRKKRKVEEKDAQEYRKSLMALGHYHCQLTETIKFGAPASPDESPSQDFLKALQNIEYVEYVLEENP